MLCVPKGTVSFIWIYASKMWKKGPLKAKDIKTQKRVTHLVASIILDVSIYLYIISTSICMYQSIFAVVSVTNTCYINMTTK